MADSVKKIEKRLLGRTGLEVSRLCYGTLAFSVYHAGISPERAILLLRKAYNSGVNFWDTAELYETYPHLNYALQEFKKSGIPDDVVISSRSYAKTYKEMRLSIEKCLEGLGRDRIEIFGLHEVQADEYDQGTFRHDAFRALVDAKSEGIIKAISVTTHSAKAAALASTVDEIDVVMPLINHKGIGIKDGTLADMELALNSLKGKGKGIYAMKVLAGGNLASDARKAIEYALENICIDSVAIGMDSIDELVLNSSIFMGQEETDEIEEKLKLKKRKLYVEPWCLGCGNCSKICPQNAIVMEFGQAKIISEKCVMCGYCITTCKDFFIKFVNEQEL